MTIQAPAAAVVDPYLRAQIEQFLYFEAELLEGGRYREWLQLTTEDIRYGVRLRSDGADGSYVFDDNRESLTWRVRRLETGMAWAEQPPSRMRYLLTNLRVSTDPERGDHAISVNFAFYRNRLETTEDLLIGRRDDVLRVTGPAMLLAQREVVLDCNVLTAHNLSFLL